MAARGRGRNHIASKTSRRYFGTDTEAVAFCSLFAKRSSGEGKEGEGRESPARSASVPLPAPCLAFLPPSPASPHRVGLGSGKGLITLKAERWREDGGGLKDRDWTAVFAVVFLNALMQAPITRPCLTYFWLRPAIVLFLPPLGRAGVDSNANELSVLLPPTSPSRPAEGEPAGERRGARGRQHWSRLG